MTKIINILGALLIILTFFIWQFAAFGFAAAFVIAMLDLEPLLILVVIVINIAAYYAVYSKKTVPGVLLTILGGSIGGAIAVHRIGEEFTARKAVKTIFQIEMWLLAWLLTGLLLYWFGYYEFWTR